MAEFGATHHGDAEAAEQDGRKTFAGTWTSPKETDDRPLTAMA